MGIFSLAVNGISTGSTANAFITLLALKLANTAGHRGRLRKLLVAGGGAAPQDLQVDIRIDRADNTGDGTSTAVATTLIFQHDQEGLASIMSAIGKNFSGEPTTFLGDQGLGGALNTRGVLLLEWPDGKGPEWGKNQALAIKGAPGSNTAATLSIAVEWEE